MTEDREFEAVLAGTGPRDAAEWSRLAETLPATTAAWADLSGFHIRSGLPGTLPVTTHLWTWAAGCWVRVRVDGQRWWAGMITADDPSGDLWSTRDRGVRVRCDRVHHWPDGSREVAQRRLDPPEALSDLSMVQLAPYLPTTGVFVGESHTLDGLG